MAALYLVARVYPEIRKRGDIVRWRRQGNRQKNGQQQRYISSQRGKILQVAHDKEEAEIIIYREQELA